MAKGQRLKDQLGRPRTTDEAIDALVDAVDRIDDAADKMEENGQLSRGKGKEDEPVKAVLDEDTKKQLADSCGKAAESHVKKLLEQRREEQVKEAEAAQKHNEEIGYYSVEQVVNDHARHYKELKDFHKADYKRIRSWQKTEVSAFMRWGNRRLDELKSHIDKSCGKAGIIRPNKPKNADFFEMQRYYFIHIPAYWFKCFFLDPHTKNYFRILIASCWMMTLGLNYFMARDMAELELAKEKYEIMRLWSHVDDGTDALSRVRVLDALFADEKNNRSEINDLIRKLKDARQQEDMKHRK